MALASQADVEAVLGRSLTEAEVSRVGALLRRADALVMGWLGCAAEPSPMPPVLVDTSAELVARALTSSISSGVEQVSVDDASVRYMADASSGGVWLSNVDKLVLRPYRCGGGVSSAQLVGDRYSITGTTP